MPIDDLRLRVLSYRWGAGSLGEPRPRVPLVIYRPVVDPTGSGRVRFEPIRAWDAACPRLAIASPRVARLALRMHRAAEDAPASDWASELVLPRFHFAFETTDEPTAPMGIDPIAWSSFSARIEDLTARPQEHFLRPTSAIGLSISPFPTPAAVYAGLEHMIGDVRRNPAFEVMQERGLIGRQQTFASWSRRLGRPSRANSVSVEAERLRSELEAYTKADPSHESGVRADLAAACEAAAIPLAGGAWGEMATGLLLSPWVAVDAPLAPAIQTILPAGTDAVFSGPTAEVDLETLRGLGDLYRDVPRRASSRGSWADAIAAREDRSRPGRGPDPRVSSDSTRQASREVPGRLASSHVTQVRGRGTTPTSNSSH